MRSYNQHRTAMIEIVLV